ncbi:hypothetical protein J7L13_01680 [bacterium]|nr:hypothetical protein [bacterium]
MPRIRSLKRFVKQNLREPIDWVEFKVLSKDEYKKRHWDFAYRIRISRQINEYEVDIWFSWDDYENKKFRTLENALEFIEKKFPKDYYIYYRYIPRVEPDPHFTNIRYIFGFTFDESMSWEIILARCMGHLNGRRFLGVKLLSNNTSKKCGICGDKASLLMVFKYGAKTYGVYYCRKCYEEKVVAELYKELLRKVNWIKHRMLSVGSENYG